MAANTTKCEMFSVAYPGFPVGGVDPLGCVDLRHGHFPAKTHAKTKELGPVEGGVHRLCPLGPPRVLQCKSIGSQVIKIISILHMSANTYDPLSPPPLDKVVHTSVGLYDLGHFCLSIRQTIVHGQPGKIAIKITAHLI